MRLIKFRAWDRYNKKFIYNFLIFSKGNVETYTECKDTVLCGAQECGMQTEMRIDAKYVNQFTGLLDKNGKEIYEGDVLSCIATKDPGYTGNRIVKFCHEYRFSACEENENFGLPMIWGGFDSLEIIGNIYENKDLLS